MTDQSDHNRAQSDTNRAQSDTDRAQVDTSRAQSDTSRAQSDTSRAQSDASRAQIDHKMIHHGPTRGAIMLFLVALLAIYMVGYFGAKVILTNSRHACFNSSQDKINSVNNFEVIAGADREISKAPGEATATKTIRGQEAVALEAGVKPVDAHIDYHLINGRNGFVGLANGSDRATAAKAHFSCDVLWPEPSLLP